MSLNFNNYLNALNSFYQEAANWSYSGATSKKQDNSSLKKKAKALQKEIKNLPPDMVRPQVVKHIEKALSL